jgi:probable O-glycosylation ligase (exosortase A-associated)
MLRTLFVLAIIAAGLYYSTGGAFYVLLFYLWNAYFRPEQWVWSDIVGSMRLSLTIYIALVVTTLLSQKSKFVINGRVVLLMLFFAQTLLSAITANDQATAWFWWPEFAKVLLIAYLIIVLSREPKHIRLVLAVVALSLGFEAAKQGYAQLVLNPGARNANEHPVLGDNNGVAMGMMMLVPIFSALANTATHRLEKFTYRFFLIGVFFRGLTTYSRGGFLSAIVLGAYFLARTQKKMRAVLGVAALVAVVLPVMPDVFWDRMRTITVSEGERDDSAGGRIHFWSVAMKMVADQPLTGVGFKGYSSSYDAYDDTDGYYGTGRAVHSTWFGILAETGIPGFTILVVSLLTSLLGVRKVAKQTKKIPELQDLRQYAIAVEISLVTFIAGGTFLNGQYGEMLWHFIGISMALSTVAAAELAKQPKKVKVEVQAARPTPPYPSSRPASAPAGAAGYARPPSPYTR